MKMKIILIALLLTAFPILLFCYEIDCKIKPDNSAVSFIEVSFNPQGEGCSSNDFTVIHHFPDGRTEKTISSAENAPWGIIDFEEFGCCDYV